MKRLKYTGVFGDLLKMGYKFQKLFARNYRCYSDNHRSPRPEYVFWLWVKERRFEIEDWHGFEVPIIEYCQTHSLIPRAVKHGKYTSLIDYYTLLCNRKTIEVREAKKDLSDDPVMFLFKKRQEK
jgi:hypothetical protein